MWNGGLAWGRIKQTLILRIWSEEKRLPILILDNRWQQLFPDDQKPAHIKKLENNLLNAMKKQSRLGTDLKELQALKKKLMSEIMLNMN